MSLFVIWLERENAILFQITQDKMERKYIKEKQDDNGALNSKPEPQSTEQQKNEFFKLIVSHLNQAQKLLILGPGVTKHHFNNYLNEHEPQLSRKVLGIETVDQPNDRQIGELAKAFFITTPS